MTHGSLFGCDGVLGVVIENGRPLASFVDHTVLVTTVWVLDPMAHVSLNGQAFGVSGFTDVYGGKTSQCSYTAEANAAYTK